MRHHALVAIALLMGAALAFHPVSAEGQSDSVMLQVDIPLVSVEVSVTDHSGRPVTNLRREDFIVTEEGSPKEIRNFSPVETPYNTLLLFDRSGSTVGAAPMLRQALGRFSGSLRPHDRVAVAAFDGRAKMLTGWKSASDARLDVRIDPTDQGTNFYGAIEWAIQQLKDVPGRKGAIIFTDGRDSRLAPKTLEVGGRTVFSVDYHVPSLAKDDDFQRILQRAQKSGVVLYFVAVNTDLNLEQGQGAGGDLLAIAEMYGVEDALEYLVAARARMESLAALSGGRVFFPRKAEEVVPVYEQISRELGTSYSIGITPADVQTGAFRLHRIGVRVQNPELQVMQSREGYWAGKKGN